MAEFTLHYGFYKGTIGYSFKKRACCPNIADQLKILTDRFNDSVGKYDKLQSESVIPKNCNSLLFNRIINLKRNIFSNACYIRREMLVICPVP